VRVWVEPSGENLPLAAAEVDGVVAPTGGRVHGWESVGGNDVLAVTLTDPEGPRRLADRLALARRVLLPSLAGPLEDLGARLRAEAVAHRSVCLRPLGRPTGGGSEGPIAALGAAYVEGGGTIDLDDPDRRLWVVETSPGRFVVAEEVGARGRSEFARRRMPQLPFQRPVSLPPRLGRVAVNLARLRSGDRVVDPFVGTGALMLEAALMGMHVSGGDRDPKMVRGAIENLTSMGCDFERLRVADAAETWRPVSGGEWDAVVTDPPYGRASGSAGESPESLVARTLPAWAQLVRPGGHVVVVQPGGPDPLPPTWRRVNCIPDRVHGSLTREFRVYVRAG
jgi:tRNA (guanine10-N2)-dimethyltransferase